MVKLRGDYSWGHVNILFTMLYFKNVALKMNKTLVLWFFLFLGNLILHFLREECTFGYLMNNSKMETFGPKKEKLIKD
jgi:hypothetical protein